MKKQTIYKILRALSIILVIVFVISVGYDIYQYNHSLSSAPFYIFIVLRAIQFILPSLIIFIVAQVIKRKV